MRCTEARFPGQRHVLLVIWMLVALFPSTAAGYHVAAWQTGLYSQTPYLTMEPGQVEVSTFRFRNEGTFTWYRDSACCPEVKLGTLNPQDRSSVFKTSTWLGSVGNRPTRLEQSQVGPNAIGDFTFDVKAPPFGTPSSTMVYDFPGIKTYREYFGVVGDGSGGDWMSNPNSPTVFLEYSVITPESPSITATSVTGSVERGIPISVGAQATDNLSIDRMVFSNPAGQYTATVGNTSTPPWIFATGQFATLPTSALIPGQHIARVQAFDRAGNSSTATLPFRVVVPAVAPQFKAHLAYVLEPAPRASRLIVRPVPDGSLLSARCLRGCGRFTGALPVADQDIQNGRGVIKLTRAAGSKVLARDQIEVDVSPPDQIGRYRTYQVKLSADKDAFRLKTREAGCLKRGLDPRRSENEPARSRCDVVD